MNLDKFSIPKEVFGILNSVDSIHEQNMLVYAVMRYIYDQDDTGAEQIQDSVAKKAFDRIKELIDKPLERARKAKARREDRKAHPEKYPPRRPKNTRRAGAVELPSGHVIESDTPIFDYYCIKGDRILYFRMIGTGKVEGRNATFASTFNSVKSIAPPRYINMLRHPGVNGH